VGDGCSLSECRRCDEIADRHSLFLGSLDDQGSFLFGVVGEDRSPDRIVQSTTGSALLFGHGDDVTKNKAPLQRVHL